MVTVVNCDLTELVSDWYVDFVLTDWVFDLDEIVWAESYHGQWCSLDNALVFSFDENLWTDFKTCDIVVSVLDVDVVIGCNSDC